MGHGLRESHSAPSRANRRVPIQQQKSNKGSAQRHRRTQAAGYSPSSSQPMTPTRAFAIGLSQGATRSARSIGLHGGRNARRGARRGVSGAVLVVVSLPPYGVTSGASSSAWEPLGYYQFIAVAVALLSYGAASAVIGSRRSSHLTLKRHIGLLGLAVGFFVLALAAFGASSGDVAQIASDVLTVFATCTPYRSVMCLT